MNFNNFTIKSQEALQHAFQVAQGNNQQAIETGHILKGLIHEAESVILFLFKKLGVNTNVLIMALDKVIESYPRVTGGEQYLSNAANRAMQKALALAQEMGDQFVSVEHILLSLLDAGDSVSQMLKDSGIQKDALKKAIEELRKGSKVDSQTAEDRFNSLNRFAINLNERARSGKLDPVIGRDDEIRRILQILSRRTKNNPILIGEPGTGKTMAAHAMAHAFSKKLLIVDYSQIESKYVGDTPKNLKKIFDFAKHIDCVIFFDEADAILSKRVTNMSSATDTSVNQTGVDHVWVKNLTVKSSKTVAYTFENYLPLAMYTRYYTWLE